MWATTVLYGTQDDKSKAVLHALAEQGAEGKLAAAILQAQRTIVDARKDSRIDETDLACRSRVPLKTICQILAVSGLPYSWGWTTNSLPLLLIDLPCGQVIFSSSNRLSGPEYTGLLDPHEWSEGNVIAYADALLKKEEPLQ